jgi:hypothetical protein
VAVNRRMVNCVDSLSPALFTFHSVYFFICCTVGNMAV